METLLVCLLVGYGVWLAAYLFWEKRQTGKSLPDAASTPAEKPQEQPDIVGKSTFRIRPKTPSTAIPTPQAATKPENEKPMENAVTFAPETEKRTSARIPNEKLDEAFVHLEIPDVPLEYEEEEAWKEEEMPLVAGRRHYASGASFEEIARAVKTAGDGSATDEDRRLAGRVFGQLGGTEFFERLSNGSAAIGEKISELMDYYLSPPAVAVTPSPDLPDGAAGFDIRDFV